MVDYMILDKSLYRPGGKHDKLNPYRVAANMVFRRLLWDFNPVSWVQRRKIALFHNKYSGQKAVILCNGPSLTDVNLSSLDGIFTFGLNKINLLFDEQLFRPSCIVSVNPFVIEQNIDFFSSTEILLFLDRVALSYSVEKRKNLILLDSCDFPYFSRDCSLSMFQGYTVTYIALQLAYYMGFSSVALIGCDHYYPYNGLPNDTIKNENEDLAHFSKNYFSSGDAWQLPDLKGSEFYYDLARRCFEESGRSIVNASTRTELSIFPRLSLEDFLKHA